MFISNIRTIRKKKGLSQEYLARAVGVSRVAISRYENGEREPKQEILGKIANALGVSVHELYGDIFNKFNSVINLDNIKYDLEEITTMDRLFKHLGYDLQFIQIGNEEYEVELNKNGEHRILSEVEYNQFKNRIKNFIDFEFYNMK